MERNPFSRLDPNEVFQRLVGLGEEWAEANAAASMLEEVQKTVLSKLVLERQTGTKSRVSAEVEALASLEYETHIEKMVEARRIANICRVKYQSAQIWAELLRSANANRRAEMGLGHLVS